MGILSDMYQGVKTLTIGETGGAAAYEKERKRKQAEEEAKRKQQQQQKIGEVQQGTNAIQNNKREKEEALKPYKKGGLVKKTGPALLHKGERVLNAKQTNKLNKQPTVAAKIGVKAPCKKKR